MGNIGSVENALRRIGQTYRTSNLPEELDLASGLVLPGVGSFDQGMLRLAEAGLTEVLRRKVCEQRVPILGICLGLQLMTLSSEEGTIPGLGWIETRSVRLRASQMPLPHIGWSTLSFTAKSHSLLRNIDEELSRFYFLHSFHLDMGPDSHEVFAWSSYGENFPALVCKGNIMGVQFHPEKSSSWGEMLLRNFCGLC